jgi:hypothetical protein
LSPLRFATVLLVLTFAVASSARADEMKPVGALGRDLTARWRLAFGGLTSDVAEDQDGRGDYKTSANALVTRIDAAAFFAPDRMRRLVGIEGSASFGYMGNDSNLPQVMPGEAAAEPPAWYGLYMAFDAGAVIGLLHEPWLHSQARGGVSLDVDAIQLYAGGRGWIGGKGLSLELEGDVRYGRSFSNDLETEIRGSGVLFFRTWGLGFLHLDGRSEDDRGRTSTRRLFKGHYSLTLLQLVFPLD